MLVLKAALCQARLPPPSSAGPFRGCHQTLSTVNRAYARKAGSSPFFRMMCKKEQKSVVNTGEDAEDNRRVVCNIPQSGTRRA
jgi:hypothetical protein